MQSYVDGVISMIEQASMKPGHVRVRLRYSTEVPTTETAMVLKDHLGVAGPYLEEVYILIPTKQAFSLLEAYLEPFELLKEHNIVPKTTTLKSFKV